MKILLGDTCLKTASAAIADRNKLVAYMQSEGEEPHSVMFPKLVAQVMATSRTKYSDIDWIVCVNGPGSFTGVRIGLTFLKTLAYTLNKPFYTLNTLDVLANSQQAKRDILSIPLIEARNSEVYTAMYRKESGVYKKISPYVAMHIDDVLKNTLLLCKKEPDLKVMLSGDAQQKYIDIFEKALEDKVIAYSEQRSSVDLCMAIQLISEQEQTDPITALPFYLRESGAVRMKKQAK